VPPTNTQSAPRGELEYHERIYSGFAQQHFAKGAVRAFRAHLAERILRRTGAGPASRVLSVGCGIGDTEILMAPRVGQMVGLDFSPAGIRQARADAEKCGARNADFIEGTLEENSAGGGFDVVFAVFFLHHLPEPDLARAPRRIMELLKPGGRFYSLDPSLYRLSGAVGSLLIPKLMQKYQSPGEAELAPSWAAGYKAARIVDDIVVRVPWLRKLSSNFEILAKKADLT
jgi:Methylase involved in ubiquinone/menaquinone biosynthesis